MRSASVVSLLLLAAAASAEPGVTKDEIVIGVCSAKTGPQKELGLSYSGGAKAFFGQLNETGGIHGRRVRIIHKDDEYEPEKAIECFNELQMAGIFAFGFAVGTPPGLKYAQMAENRKIPFLGLSAGPAFMYDSKNKYVFSGRASYEDETRAEVERLWAAGVRKIGVIFQNDGFGVAGLEGVKQALKKHGADIVAQGSYPRNTVDVDEAYKQVKAAKPEAVVLAAVAKPAAAVLVKAKADGWKPRFVTVAGRDSLLVAAAGDAAEGVVVANAVPPADQTHLPTIQLHNKHIGKFAPEAIPGAASVQGFVEAMILAEGLKRAGKQPTREGLVKALESVKGFDTGLGPDFKVDYGPGDHRGFSHFVFSVIRGGKGVVADDWASAK